MGLATALQQAALGPGHHAPLWAGPQAAEGTQGGITQGLLKHYLECGERFRVRAMEGLAAADAFSHRLFYGELWHLCEKWLASGAPSRSPDWRALTRDHAQHAAGKYPLQREQIAHWLAVCHCQFPCYVDYWRQHPEVLERQPLLQEQTFRVPYTLPSGRTVYLRGRWDAVDRIGDKVYLQENKTKGDVDEELLKRHLSSGFELQVMFYLSALATLLADSCSCPPAAQGATVAGVRYNVIRRPLSGGRYSIRRLGPTKKCPAGESREGFYGRLRELIKGEPGWYFMRWRVDLLPADLERFRRMCLEPVLEDLCDDYQWWEHCWRRGGDPVPVGPVFAYQERSARFPAHRRRHYRMPYMSYSSLAERGSTEYDHYLTTGATVGLRRAKGLFGELED